MQAHLPPNDVKPPRRIFRRSARVRDRTRDRELNAMARLPFPEPRKLPWRLKSIDSAETSLTYDRYGRMVMQIRHDLLKGLTPAMVAWWFANIGGDMEVEGVRLNRYLVWHPFDHIHWALVRPGESGRAGKGAQFRIVEAFGRNDAFRIDVIETVTRLDPSGITLVGTRLGQQISRINHDFIAAGDDTLYLSTLTIGVDTPGLCRLVNPIVHRAMFPEAMGQAWLKHNVEEVGLLEHIVPLIYAAP